MCDKAIRLSSIYNCNWLVAYALTHIGDGYETCENIDECELEQDNCSPDAHCSDTDGSFDCTCPEGGLIILDPTTILSFLELL